MEQLPHYLDFRGTMPRVHVRARHQSAATRFRAKVRKSEKNKSQKTEGKKLHSVLLGIPLYTVCWARLSRAVHIWGIGTRAM